MIGLRFGLLTIVSQAPSTQHGKRRWVCDCDCGGTAVTTTTALRSGNTKSCGCLRHRTYPSQFVFVGDRFGRLVVRQEVGRDRRRQRLWLCDCDCGAVHMATTAQLRKGVQSCGCLRDDRVRQAQTKHGAAGSATAGRRTRSETPEYRTWCGLKSRCYNPRVARYPEYGGRGIMVCDRWRSDFAAFLADMGPKPSPAHSIDRMDVNGNYEPGNCRWASPREQRANQRRVLTDEQVRDIRSRPRTKGSGNALAAEFGVSAALVSLVRSGKYPATC